MSWAAFKKRAVLAWEVLTQKTGPVRETGNVKMLVSTFGSDIAWVNKHGERVTPFDNITITRLTDVLFRIFLYYEGEVMGSMIVSLFQLDVLRLSSLHGVIELEAV